ncbi:MAG: NIPSNAP family protein [Planctomicrobium sp.]|nr:NIPSNAP family protein [Planctomicrobium sp.]
MLRSFFAALCLVMVSCASGIADDGVYELRIYTCEPGKLNALNERFREHTLQLFEKHGIENIAYWTPTAGEKEDPRLIYVIKHKSRDAAKESWKAFIADPEWKAVAKASAEAHGKILAKAPESVYMTATDYSPEAGKVNQKKVYELRTYTTAEGRLDNLNARFRDHTVEIFKRNGLDSFAYWTPLDEPKSSNTLIYVLEYESQAQAKESWKKFGADPAWKKARAESEKDGRILSQRPESVYMVPTDYSPAR